jgi:formylglycine-generating enzyme required for sulfatase activity
MRIFLFQPLLSLGTGLIVVVGSFLCTLPLQAQECPPEKRAEATAVPVFEDMVNPNSSAEDIELPMPCDAKLILRHVCVPAEGYFGDARIDLGCKDCGRLDQSFMEGKHKQAISGSFTLQDIPATWRLKLTELADSGDGRCPKPEDTTHKGFYYFIGKYEITNFQWKAVMEQDCPVLKGLLTVDDPRPKTDISWFEAVEFTRKYTEWLIKNAPEALPKFSNNRFGYIRLPTEAEWEYAARGGHRVTESQMNEAEFFPLNERSITDFAVFTQLGAAKPPEKLAWIGTKCPNPLGLFDTAGNAAEMVLDPFRFSVGFRLHGASGGFIIKGGSFRKGRFEIMPGRREEQPFFLGDGAFHSSDVGLRVVLSGILTAEDRIASLDQEWALLGRQQSSGQEKTKSAETNIEMDQSKDPIAEIDRLLAISADETEKKNLLFLREVLKQNSILLGEQKAETVRGIIRSALLTAESMQNYAIRRKVIVNELGKLKRMKAETVSQSILDSMENGIVKAKETVRMIDAALDHFAEFYLNRIREIQRYPAELFESQISLTSQELSLEEGFSRNLKRRLDELKRHVAHYKNQAGNISQKEIQEDILGN